MRKAQGTGRLSSDRIVLRAERAAAPRPAAVASRVSRTSRSVRKAAAKTMPRSGVTMDYQMGFTSGPSN